MMLLLLSALLASNMSIESVDMKRGGLEEATNRIAKRAWAAMLVEEWEGMDGGSLLVARWKRRRKRSEGST